MQCPNCVIEMWKSQSGEFICSKCGMHVKDNATPDEAVNFKAQFDKMRMITDIPEEFLPSSIYINPIMNITPIFSGEITMSAPAYNIPKNFVMVLIDRPEDVELIKVGTKVRLQILSEPS